MANRSLGKTHFLISIVVHLLIVFGVGYLIKRDAVSNKNFVIFGAHSRYTTKALYKSGTIPFSTPHATPSNKQKVGDKKKQKGKKAAQKKREKKVKAAQKKITKQVPQKKAAAPAKSAQPSKNAKKNIEQAKQPPPKTAAKEETKKNLKKKAPEKPLAKNEAALAAVQEVVEKKEPLSPTEKIEPLEEPVQNDVIEPVVAPAAEADQPLIESEEEDDDVIHLGVVDAADPVTRYHQRVISQEFNRVWRPPGGVCKGTECTVKITIDKTGAIGSIDFIKRSQIPIYDLSILRLKLAKLELPSSLYGKNMIVVFHQ